MAITNKGIILSAIASAKAALDIAAAACNDGRLEDTIVTLADAGGTVQIAIKNAALNVNS